MNLNVFCPVFLTPCYVVDNFCCCFCFLQEISQSSRSSKSSRNQQSSSCSQFPSYCSSKSTNHAKTSMACSMETVPSETNILYLMFNTFVYKGTANGKGSLLFDSRAGQIRRSAANGSPPLRFFVEAVLPRCKLRRWAPQLITRFGVIPRV